MPPENKINPLAEKVAVALTNFTGWLEHYGETSWDHQSFYAGVYGKCAKRLYYASKLLGTAAVAPMVFCEAYLPGARRLFHHRIRLPIADAHYAMGFAFLHEATGEAAYLEQAVHFLEALKRTRCPDYPELGPAYP